MSNIVIGISSGIAAYKISDLIKKLIKSGHYINVIMTKNSVHLISPGKVEELTGNKVFLNLFEENFTPEKILDERKVDHIEVAKNADLFIVAPATANTTAKLAMGIADDFLTTAILATTAPVLICPSMNTNMWNHPATQKNLKQIQSFGYEILFPATGKLACGTHGRGRLPETQEIEQTVEMILSRKKILKGQKVIITSGGTTEPIDDARVITNRSSGKMGKALAEAAYRYGANTTFIRAERSVKSNLPIKQVTFTTSTDLEKILQHEVKNADIIFHAAAVSDFIPNKVDGKINSDKRLEIEFEPTRKIINKIKNINSKCILVAFKAVSTSDESEIKVKTDKLFKNSHADYIIVNNISRTDIGFESDENEVQILGNDGKIKFIPINSKEAIAREIVEKIFKTDQLSK